MRLAATTLVLASAALLAAPQGPRRLSGRDPEANAWLARMTLDEKIGQMTQAEQDKLVDERDIQDYSLGSLLSGGDSDPPSNGFEDWRAMYERYQARALKTRLGIPLLYGVDAVHGHSNVIGAVVFPHDIGLGATRDPRLVEQVARITAEEVRATGIQWSFAPCLAVVQDVRWGRSYESFSEDPELVAELGEAAVRGLQGPELGGDPLRVLACAKHFVGDGGTAWGTGKPDPQAPGGRYPLDQGDTRLPEAELRKLHMRGYVKAIEAGVGSIMPSFSSWNGVKCSGSRRLLTEVLKDELGFEGFLISDYDALDALSGDRGSQVAQAINAGMDMVMVPARYREFHATLKALVEAGKVPVSRIDDAVRRILRVKLALGLLDPGRSQLADHSLEARFGSPEHRAVARQAVRESVVLLKNAHAALPLPRGAKRLHVAGSNADDLGNQCGGWTITWQGSSGTPTRGTTLLAALRAASPPGTQVTYSLDGTGAEGADRGVVIVGETPYAEYLGDREDLGLARRDLEAVERVKRAGVPVVLVVVSGRPLVLGKALEQADAVVAAWLPGSEGQGVADVLMGDYAPTGKLPFSWPASTSQLAAGDRSHSLFPYGFGLSY